MKKVNRNVFKLALFYNWTLKNKPHTLIISTGGFYYRLSGVVLYDVLYVNDYFDEED
jgi:hypothetical protein